MLLFPNSIKHSSTPSACRQFTFLWYSGVCLSLSSKTLSSRIQFVWYTPNGSVAGRPILHLDRGCAPYRKLPSLGRMLEFAVHGNTHISSGPIPCCGIGKFNFRLNNDNSCQIRIRSIMHWTTTWAGPGQVEDRRIRVRERNDNESRRI